MELKETQPPQNPADRPFVTFDTNIVIALRNNESAAKYIRQLLAWNRASFITVNITLSTLLEEQRPGEEIRMQDYVSWLEAQGVDRNNIFTSSRTVGFRFPDTPPNTTIFDVGLEMKLNQRLHEILFPTIPFDWHVYRERESKQLGLIEAQREAMIELDNARYYIPPTPSHPMQMPTPAFDSLTTQQREEVITVRKRLSRTWMNAKNDALGLYNHLTNTWHTNHRDLAVFVTYDRNFRKESRSTALKKLGYFGEILTPEEAVNFLSAALGLEA